MRRRIAPSSKIISKMSHENWDLMLADTNAMEGGRVDDNCKRGTNWSLVDAIMLYDSAPFFVAISQLIFGDSQCLEFVKIK